MKLTLKALAAVAVCALVSSCATISNPVTATTNPLGSKCGVAKSTLYLGGLWSSKGAENGIDKAAKEAGITKISHVDSYVKSYFFGIVEEQITKVYGE
jgi:hypothetical protein